MKYGKDKESFQGLNKYLDYNTPMPSTHVPVHDMTILSHIDGDLESSKFMDMDFEDGNNNQRDMMQQVSKFNFKKKSSGEQKQEPKKSMIPPVIPPL